MSGEESSQDAFARQVPDAFARWARTVFAAPRQPQELISDVRACDEIVERLVTRVIRRDIREVRTPTSERRSTASPLDPSTLDPFAFSQETLRASSQYIAQCDECEASGMTRCNRCRGNGTVVCSNCAGTGKQRSDASNRLINCKVCKKAGRVMCGPCVGSGTLACKDCFGSGHQLAWLAFDETELSLVSVSPHGSPIVLAHRALEAARPLAEGDLSAFSVLEEKRSQGPLRLDELPPPHDLLPRAQRAAMDARRERIASQQYLRLAVVRRDVTYEMSGTRGIVALSGNTLIGATTRDATRPIRRRLYLWIASIVFLLGLSMLLRSAFVGMSDYFDGARRAANGLAIATVVLALPALGALLRAWRGGTRFRRISPAIRVLAGGSMLALASIAIVGLATRPSTSDVRSALASKDAARARVVLESLKEHETGRDIADLEDRVSLVEADGKLGNDRLRVLDEVAARRGDAAGEAAAKARAYRLAIIRDAIGRQDSKAAMAVLEQSFASDRSEEIAEERARAHEVEISRCKIDACRFAVSARASTARASRERIAQTARYRTSALEALAIDRIDAKAPTKVRLEQLRGLGAVGTQTLAVVENDPELRAGATAAIAFADAERSKTPLLRADLEIIEELLGKSSQSETGVPRIDLGGTHAYFAFDTTKKCNGIYVIGADPTTRKLASNTWPVDRLVSQATGTPVNLKAPAEHTDTVQSYVGGYAMTARWRLGDLVELRLGEATP